MPKKGVVQVPLKVRNAYHQRLNRNPWEASYLVDQWGDTWPGPYEQAESEAVYCSDRALANIAEDKT